MKTNLLFVPFLLKGVLFSSLVGAFVAAVFYVPGFLVGLLIEVFSDELKNQARYLAGGLTLGASYLVLSSDFLKMYSDKSVDTPSLNDLPFKMLYLLFGLTVATYSMLVGLMPWENRVHIYDAPASPTYYSMGVFVLDNLCRGVFLDVFEVFGLRIGSLEHNTKNFIFSAYLVAFRFLSSGLLFAHVFLRYKEFKHPGWHEEYREKKRNAAATASAA